MQFWVDLKAGKTMLNCTTLFNSALYFRWPWEQAKHDTKLRVRTRSVQGAPKLEHAWGPFFPAGKLPVESYSLLTAIAAFIFLSLPTGCHGRRRTGMRPCSAGVLILGWLWEVVRRPIWPRGYLTMATRQGCALAPEKSYQIRIPACKVF